MAMVASALALLCGMAQAIPAQVGQMALLQSVEVDSGFTVVADVEAAPGDLALSTMFDDVFAQRPQFLEEQAEEAHRFPVPTGH